MTTHQLIDSHAHLDGPEYDDNRADVLGRARAAGVSPIVVIGSGRDLASAQRAVALAESEPDIYATVGIHPHDAARFDEAWWPQLLELASRDRVVAVGETGLDYYYDLSPPKAQQEQFRGHLALCGEVELPVICHVRDAHEDARAILREAAEITATHGGVIHCFTGTPEDAAAYVAMGLYLSFSGIVTFRGKSADPIRQALRETPPDRLLLETDCPYLAPMPVRGKRNEPAFVAHTAAKIAEEARSAWRSSPLERSLTPGDSSA